MTTERRYGPAGDRRSEGNHPDESPAGPTPSSEIVAMSYGCTCHYEDSTSAGHNSWCRHGEPAAVKVAAWQEQVERLRLATITIDNLTSQLAAQQAEIRDLTDRLAQCDRNWEEATVAWNRLREERGLLRQIAQLAPRPPWFKTDTGGYVRALDALAAYDHAREATTDG